MSPRRYILSLGLCATLAALALPATARVSAATLQHTTQTRLGASCTASGTTIASGDNYPSYTADYFLYNLRTTPNAPVPLLVAAFVDPGKSVTYDAASLLVYKASPSDPQFFVPYAPSGAQQTWSLSACGGPDVGSKSVRYLFNGGWAGGPAGSYVLAVHFYMNGNEADGIDYYINVEVDPNTGGLTSAHWDTEMGLAVTVPFRPKYNLADLVTPKNRGTVAFHTTFTVNSGNTPLNATADIGIYNVVPGLPAIFTKQNLPNTGVFTNFTAPSGRSEGQASLNMDMWSGGPIYAGQVVERVYFTDPSDLSNYFVKVGRYVVDNSLTESFETASGTQSVTDLGEGKGFTFYANPGPPSAKNAYAGRPVKITWQKVLPRYIDLPHTSVSYTVWACKITAPSTCFYASSDVTDASPGTPGTLTASITGMDAADYMAHVVAHFTISNAGHEVHVDSDPQNGPITVGDPLTITGHFSTSTKSYGWTDNSSGGTATYTLLPTTGANRTDPNDAGTFNWPVGEKMTFLPAVQDNPALTTLSLTEFEGSRPIYHTLSIPVSVQSTSYQIMGGDCPDLAGTDQLTGLSHTYGSSADYTFEVPPVNGEGTSATPLPGALSLAWATEPYYGTPPSGTTVCQLYTYLQGHGGLLDPTGMAVSYQVKQTTTFTLLFPANPPPSSSATCGQLVAYYVDPSDGDPRSAFSGQPYAEAARGECDQGQLDVDAAIAAFTDPRSLAQTAGAPITFDPTFNPASRYTIVGGGLRTDPVTGDQRLTIQLTSTTATQAMHYHLLLPHEIGQH